MSWIEALPAVLLAVFVLIVPGAGIAWVFRFRGISFFAIAIAASLAISGFASIVLPTFDIHWGLINVLAFGVVITAVCFVVRLIPAINRQINPYGNWSGSYQYLGVLVSTGILVVSFLLVSGNASAVSQTYDVVFHYNLTQYIVDTGIASPLQMSMIWQSSPAFYPSLWQAMAALISPLAGAISANNILVLVIIGILWPFSATFMVQVILGDRRQYLLLTGVLAAAFPAFPLLFADWGALYPSLMSYSLIPIAFASIVSLCGLAHSPTDGFSAGVVLLGTCFAMGVAQPSGIYALLVIAIVPIAIFVAQTLRNQNLKFMWRMLIMFSTIIGTGLFLLLWRAGINSNHWDIRISPSQSAGDVLFNAVPGRLPGLTVSVLAVIGAVIIWKQAKQRWILVVYLLVATLYVFASSLPLESLRNIFAGIWYADNRRIMAFLPIAVILMAVLGASHLFSWIREKGFQEYSRPKYIAIFLIGLIFVSQLVGMNYARYALWKEYEFDALSDLITPDEQRVFDYIGEYVSQDAVIVGHPWTGTSLVYPTTQRDVIFHHMTGDYSAEQAYIAQNLNHPDQKVCTLLQKYNVTHALDFGPRLIFDDFTKADVPEQVNFFRGLNALEGSSILSEIFASGEARLYEVTGCN